MNLNIEIVKPQHLTLLPRCFRDFVRNPGDLTSQSAHRIDAYVHAEEPPGVTGCSCHEVRGSDVLELSR